MICFGKNQHGQLGISSQNSNLTPEFIEEFKDIKSVYCAKEHTFFLKGLITKKDFLWAYKKNDSTENGYVYATGNNENDQLNLGSNTKISLEFKKTTLSNIKSILTGEKHTIFIQSKSFFFFKFNTNKKFFRQWTNFCFRK